MSKTQDEAYDLLEEMAMHKYQWPNERQVPKRALGVHEIDAKLALSVQVQSLTQQLKAAQVTSKIAQVIVVCELCAGQHPSEECQQGNPFVRPLTDQA